MTAFPSPGNVLGEAPNWWELATGEPPDSKVSQPKVGAVQEQGSFSTGVLTLLSQPGRIDWLLNWPEIAEVLKPFEESVVPFVSLIQRWFSAAPPIQRLAFGAVLRLPVEDRIEGYNKLSTYLHYLDIDPEGSTELLFQINRPRRSSLSNNGLTINRLSKWSVAFAQQMTYRVQAPETGALQVTNLQKDLFCRLEMDINTAPKSDDLDAGSLPEIFGELVGFAREIALNGDTP